MTLLDNHLEQISLSSAAIAELPFPPPKIFTNSLLNSHDITALIRDTESHERLLFTLAPQDKKNARRNTSHGLQDHPPFAVNGEDGTEVRRMRPTVATLLGGDLGERVRNESAKEGKDRGEVDVDLLLKGAEKLCSVYPIQGAAEKITSLRSRHERLSGSIARYEQRIAKQMIQLEKMNRSKHGPGYADYDEENDDADVIEKNGETTQAYVVTEEDLKREDGDIRELEKKKRTLEERVSGMERDLGGLLR